SRRGSIPLRQFIDGAQRRPQPGPRTCDVRPPPPPWRRVCLGTRPRLPRCGHKKGKDMNTSIILTKTATLAFIDKRDWVDGGPHSWGRISSSMFEVMLSQVVREAASKLNNRAAAVQVRDLGRKLFERGSKGSIVGWEDGDDICPPWKPWPHFPAFVPFPFPSPGPGPDPDPWPIDQLTFVDVLPAAVQDVLIAGAIRQAASLTSDKELSEGLKQASEGIMKGLGATGALFDEFCGTPV